MDILDRADVEAAGGLGGNDKLGLALKFTSHDHLLLVAAGQVTSVKENAWRTDIEIDTKLGRRPVDHFPVHGGASGVGRIVIVVQNHILGNREIGDHATSMSVLGDMRHAHGVACAHRGVGDLLAQEKDLAMCGAAQPGDCFDKGGLTISLNACDANDLARLYGQRQMIDGDLIVFAQHDKVADLQYRFFGLGGRLVDLEAHGTANHHLGQVLLTDRLRITLADDPPGTQDVDPVRDREDFVQLVSDEDDGFAGVAQGSHDLEEVLDLLRCQDGGWFVEDEDVCRPEQNLEDLHALLQANGQVLDQRVRVDLQPVFLIDLADLSASGIEVKIVEPPGGLDAQHHVLGHGEDGNEHEVLVHHANAGGDGLSGALERDLLAVDQNRALVGVVEPAEHVHKGRLAGTVLTQQAQHLAAADGQVDLRIGDNRTKTLGNAAQFNIHRKPPPQTIENGRPDGRPPDRPTCRP